MCEGAEDVDSFTQRSGSDVRGLLVDCELNEDTRTAEHSLVIRTESEGNYE